MLASLLPGLSLLIAPSVQAVPVDFQVELAVAQAYGQLVDGSVVLLAGDFNAWDGSQNPLTAQGTLWQTQAELSPGFHQWKFVIQDSGGGLLWESSIENRQSVIPAGPLQLPLAWWDRLDAPAIPLQPAQIRFRCDTSLIQAQGLFHPQSDQLAILGAHTALGNWQLPSALLDLEQGSEYGAWLSFSGLCEQPVAWKAVVIPGDGAPWIWEAGLDHSLVWSGSDLDTWPPPAGDGVADAELPLRLFGHGPGWQPEEVALGADLSFTARLESEGAVWSRRGEAGDLFDLYRDTGWSILRLRLWHSPNDPWHGLDSTIALARRGQQAGFRLLLDLHFSDSWADPGQQTPPAIWQGLPLATLADSLRNYTARVIQRFHGEGLDPEWVQLGNEIDGGLLWPVGAVGGANDTPAQWDNLATLLAAAAEGAWQDLPVDARPRRLIHLSQGGNATGVMRFLEEMASRGLSWESTGLSFYPWWHGDFSALRTTLGRVCTERPEEVLIVETDYPWTLDWNDNTGNFVGLPEQLLEGFPATPQGQLDYYRALRALCRDQPGTGVSAICLWEPAWISTSGFGSVQENLALFDFQGNALPALDLLVPRAPQLQLLSASPGFLSLVWTTVDGAGEYRVESAPTPDGPWRIAAECSVSGCVFPAPLGTRCYRVVALAGGH